MGMAAPAPGAPAPDFELPDATGARVALRDFRGKRNVVLLFYPGAFTPVCTRQMCEFRDAGPDFGALDADVLAVSHDPPEKLKKWAERHALGMRLLSDPEREVARCYDAVGILGLPWRSTFVIDKAGVVRYAKHQVPLFRPDTGDVRRALAALATAGDAA